MTGRPTAGDFLADETRALLTRVDRLRPFVLQETMLPAAALLPRTLVAIEALLLRERAKLHGLGQSYLRWLGGPGRSAPTAEQQRRFTVIRLRLNEHLAQLDLFADAVTQRSESETGLWLSGLDVAARDALRLNDGAGGLEEVPVICYLDRGPGAAIRRARTRLPGGVANPVAVIRIPRERMVGHGIASSLVHEVGHQGAALLELVPSLRAELSGRARSTEDAWHCWAAWISEIIADFWSVAKLGIGSTLGLIGVVSLPRPFVFRFTLDDPHPFPWIRVMVSAAIGDRLYPDPQWTRLTGLWREMYPLSSAPSRVTEVIGRLEPTIPELADILATHAPPRLGGLTLQDALAHQSRNPDALRTLFSTSVRQPAHAARVRPALRFAMLGQARWDRRLAAGQESRATDRMLTGWAAQSTLQMAMATTRIHSAITERH
ncbi:hypothetical protein DMH04_09135 [Kibdelosporangium aridum]|uniref:Uncharacterized protein n=1 Tax=Kibdelosporangium aridum TaxID=2030 RepID=A0A428ZIT4_KIBAR|nr:hypothetical protein [Kibdelosporangium aridum]RSM87880.1 hypothetical protein DMH04_09135 [Kibdelosporangium aridum]